MFMMNQKKAAELRVNALIQRRLFCLFHSGLLGNLSNTGKPSLLRCSEHSPALRFITFHSSLFTIHFFRSPALWFINFTVHFSGLLSKPSKPDNMSKPSNPSLLR